MSRPLLPRGATEPAVASPRAGRRRDERKRILVSLTSRVLLNFFFIFSRFIEFSFKCMSVITTSASLMYNTWEADDASTTSNLEKSEHYEQKNSARRWEKKIMFTNDLAGTLLRRGWWLAITRYKFLLSRASQTNGGGLQDEMEDNYKLLNFLSKRWDALSGRSNSLIGAITMTIG